MFCKTDCIKKGSYTECWGGAEKHTSNIQYRASKKALKSVLGQDSNKSHPHKRGGSREISNERNPYVILNFISGY